jgi:glycine/D-amino acid oxidase-like deaminating enzyme
MDKVAIIGAGLCGLAACWHLSQRCQVTVFDSVGIGGGASGVCAGLMHPYPGEQGRLSWNAKQGLDATKQLLEISERALGQPVASFTGILRLKPLIQSFDDVEPLGDANLIHSGVTVYTSLYLQGLWLACEQLGAKLCIAHVNSLDELQEYDQIVIAAGDGVLRFKECAHLNVKLIKGQVLTCAHPTLERSMISKGYLAKSAIPDQCHFGATYERQFTSKEPCLQTALEHLKPKMENFFSPTTILDCKAGVRVAAQGHYRPILEQLNPKTWVLTAMGSRGLLYHAYFAEMLSQSMLQILNG